MPRAARLIGLAGLRDHPHASVALAHGAALLVASILLAIEPLESPARWSTAGPALIAVGLSSLRVASASRHLAVSTLILDGIATALLVASTGAPGSPFYFLALAGIWWAARLPGRTDFAFAVSFAIAYAVLIVPSAFQRGQLALAVEEPLTVLLIAALAYRFAVRDGGVAEAKAATLASDSTRAGRSPLPAMQSELLAYLVMGLTNREIADRWGISERSVRSRLTALYRLLGVRGRQEARLRAHRFGVGRGP